jgi:hypothetical protein
LKVVQQAGDLFVTAGKVPAQLSFEGGRLEKLLAAVRRQNLEGCRRGKAGAAVEPLKKALQMQG